MAVDLFNLTGKVALVTGGSKGLGKAMARIFAQAGADVVISSRTEGDLRAAMDEIILETGKDLSERSKTSTHQDVRMAILRRAEPRSGECRQLIAFQYVNSLEVARQDAGGGQSPDPGTNNHGTVAKYAAHTETPVVEVWRRGLVASVS